jgi:hypothetical protein
MSGCGTEANRCDVWEQTATSKPKGLAASRHADDEADGKEKDDDAADGAEGEPDDDHSSTALASVRTPLA